MTKQSSRNGVDGGGRGKVDSAESEVRRERQRIDNAARDRCDRSGTERARNDQGAPAAAAVLVVMALASLASFVSVAGTVLIYDANIYQYGPLGGYSGDWTGVLGIALPSWRRSSTPSRRGGSASLGPS